MNTRNYNEKYTGIHSQLSRIVSNALIDVQFSKICFFAVNYKDMLLNFKS